MRELKAGDPICIPSPPFGDLVIQAGGRISEDTYERVAKSDRRRFKKVTEPVATDDTTAPDDGAQTPE